MDNGTLLTVTYMVLPFYVKTFASKRKTLIPPPVAVRKHCVRKPPHVSLSLYINEALYYLRQYSLLKRNNSLPELSKKCLIFSFVFIWNIAVSKSYLLGLSGSRS